MPISSNEFVQQIEKYIKPPNKQYREALALFNRVLLSKLGDLTPEVLERALSEVHTIVLHLPDDDDAKALYSSVVKELSKLSDPDKVLCLFYQRASQTYLSLNDDTNAVSYISSALCLAEERKLLLLLDGIKKEIEGLYSFFMRKSLLPVWKELLPEQIRLLGSQKEPPLALYLESIAELSHGEAAQIKEVYTMLESLISLWLSWAEKQLKRTYQVSLDVFSETVEKLLPVVQLFEAHHQWDRALQLYYAILKYSRFEARDYDRRAIEETIGALIHYQQQTKKPPVFKIAYQWREWRDRLDGNRKKLHERLMATEDVLTAQAAFTKDIRILLSDIVDAITLQLGESPLVREVSGATHPCGFTVLGLGSLSRGDFCPYSDVDIALLIEDGSLRDHPYFQTLLRLFQLNVNLAGEKEGFWVDEGDIKCLVEGEKSHLDTPEGLLKRYHPSFLIKERPALLQEIHSLHTSVPIYANESGQFLFAEYQGLLENAYKAVLPDKKMTVNRKWALEHLAKQYSSHHKALGDDKKASIDLKEYFLRPLTMWCYDMVLYFNGPSRKQSLITLLEQLSLVIDKEFLTLFRHVLSDCQYERIMQQFNVKKQLVFLENVSSEEQAKWETLYNACIRVLFFISQEKHLEESPSPFHPLLNYIEAICKGLFSDEGKERVMLPDEREIFKYFIEHLIHQEAPAERHQVIYQRLSKYMTAHQLREDHIHYLREQSKLEVSFINYLETFPDQAGRRVSVDRARKRWRDDLQKILWPKSKTIPTGYEKLPVIDLHSATEGHCILHLIVVQQLLEQQCIDEQGRIRPKEEHRRDHRGRHTVMAIDVSIDGERIQVYLKLFPEMPGMEYFAGEMARRIAGHGAAFVDLARWRAGKEAKYDYPILISHALVGPGLETLLRDTMVETLKQLDPYHLGLLTLFEMLIGSEDAKPDNFVVHMPREGSENRVVTLASFDRERSGYPSVLHRENTVIPLIKNVVFCLDHMNEAITPAVRDAFLALDPYTLLNELLQEAQRFTMQIYRVYTPTEVQRVFVGQGLKALFSRLTNVPLVNFSILPVPLREGFIEECYAKLCWLQQQLERHEENATYFSLYRGIEPHLGHWYQSLYENHTTPVERFNQGPRQYYPEEIKKEESQSTVTPTGLQTAPQTLQTMHGKPVRGNELDKYRDYCEREARENLERIHREYQQVESIRAQLEAGNSDGLVALSRLDPTELVETILGKLEKISDDFQGPIIDILKEVRRRGLKRPGRFSFKRLVFKNYSRLNSSDLTSLLWGSWQLVKLDITGSSLDEDINTTLIPLLEEHTANLEILNLNNLPELNALESEKARLGNVLFFPELKKLRLNGCKNLKRIRMPAPKLKWLEVNGCEELSEITLVGESSQLKGLFCGRSERLKKINIHAPNLEIASFVGCTELLFGELTRFLNQSMSRHQRLELRGCAAIEDWGNKNITNEKLQPLLELLKHEKTIREINLYGNRLTDVSIDALLSLLEVNQTLCEINVRGNWISEEKKAMLSRVLGPRQVRLQLEGMKASTKVITEIDWGTKGIGDAEVSLLIDFLKDNVTVREIDLSENYITDKGIDALLSLLKVNQTICEIAVRKNLISEEKEKMLSRVLGPRYACWQLEETKVSTEVITKIHWRNKGIGDAEVSLLIDFLKDNETVREIVLSSNHLTDKSIDALLSLLDVNRTLCEIDIKFNSISEEKRKMLSRILASNYSYEQLKKKLEKMRASTDIITKINWRNQKIEDIGTSLLINFLKDNKTVREIDLSKNHLTDKGIDALLSLLEVNQTLCEINVSGNSISKEKEKILSRVLAPRYVRWKLEEMKASTEVITEIGWSCKEIGDAELNLLIDFLKDNETIREIALSCNCLTDKGIDALLSLLEMNQTLCKIEIWGNSISKEKREMLSRVLDPRCVCWELEMMKVSEDVITEIDWSCKEIGDAGLSLLIDFLKDNETIRKIDLSYNRLTDEGIDVLLSLLEMNQTLCKIEILGDSISKEKREMLSRVLGPRFVCWELEKMKMSEDVIMEIYWSGKINWRNQGIGDAGVTLLINFLKDNNMVREIDLSYNYLTDKGIDALLSLLEVNQTLCKIDISGNSISEGKKEELSRFLGTRSAHWELKKMMTLRDVITEIDWSGKEIGNVGLNLLVAFLKTNETVREIDLSKNQLTGEGVDALLSLLEVNQVLCKIDISGNLISEGKKEELSCVLGAQSARWELKKMMESRDVITEIDWSGKEIGNVGLNLLVAFLKTNETVREIDLSKNQLTDEGVDALLSLLEGNQVLCKIDISGNSISEEKRKILSRVLASNCACGQVKKKLEKMRASTDIITKINWRYEKIGDAGITLLIDFLKDNETVRGIHLSGNDVTDKSIDALLSLLEVNRTLCKINIGFNSISKEKRELLSRVLGPRYARWQLEKMEASTEVITEIDWWYKSIGDAEVSLLADFLKDNRTVRNIVLTSNYLTDKSIDALLSLLEGNQTLCEVNVSGNSISNEKKEMLSRILGPRYTCWQLEEMKMSKAVVTDIFWCDKGIGEAEVSLLIDFLKDNETVRKIDLSRNHLTDKSIAPLLSLLEVNQMLCDIDVSRNSISEEKEAMLSRILGPRFACWELEKMKTSAEVITKIDWRKQGIGDAGVSLLIDFLKENERVREINLLDNHLTDKSVDALLSLLEVNQTLREIDVSENSISKEKEKKLSRVLGSRYARWQLDEMKASEDLVTKIDWRNQGIGDAEVRLLIDFLKENKTVREISLSKNHLTDRGIDALLSLLEANQTLCEIYVFGNSITKEKKGMLARALGPRYARRQIEEMKASKDVITAIDWRSRGIGDAELGLLIGFLKNNKTIRKIDLKRNYLTDKSGFLVSQFLKENMSVVEINLNNNHLTDKTISFLLDMLDINQDIKKISIYGNKICYQQAKKLADILVNRTLDSWPDRKKTRYLDLTSSYITDDSIISRVQYLFGHWRVEGIYLSSNFITDKSIALLLEIVKANKNLQCLSLFGNPINLAKRQRLSLLLAPRFVNSKLMLYRIYRGVQEIKWRNKGIGDVEVERLIVFLQTEPGKEIISIDLSSNYITDKGAEVLLLFLKCARRVNIFNISGNFISVAKEHELLALCKMQSIANDLDVKRDELLDYGNLQGYWMSSADLLGVPFSADTPTKSYCEIDLSYNCFTDDDIEHIEFFIQKNPWLCKLNLAENEISGKGMERIEAILVERTKKVFSQICEDIFGNKTSVRAIVAAMNQPAEYATTGRLFEILLQSTFDNYFSSKLTEEEHYSEVYCKHLFKIIASDPQKYGYSCGEMIEPRQSDLLQLGFLHSPSSANIKPGATEEDSPSASLQQ